MERMRTMLGLHCWTTYSASIKSKGVMSISQKSWGHVTLYIAADTEPVGSIGYFRKVGAGVDCKEQTPLAIGWHCTGVQKWSLVEKPSDTPIDSDSLEEACTLREFSAAVREAPTAENLGRLDWTVYYLLEATQQLHNQNRGLGMLTADNVVCLPNKGNQIILADHGFTHKGAFPPNWLEHPPAGSELWEEKIHKQQHLAINADEAAKLNDISLLISIFQGCLIDDWRRQVLPPEQRSRSKGFSTNCPLLWAELYDLDVEIEDGKLDSSTAMSRLSAVVSNDTERRLTDHFREPKLVPKPKRNGCLSLVFVAIFLFGVAGAAYWYMNFGPQGRVSVPDVVGLSAEDAQALMDGAGLKSIVIMEATEPYGLVHRQDPQSGTDITSGGQVSVIVGEKSGAAEKEAAQQDKPRGSRILEILSTVNDVNDLEPLLAALESADAEALSSDEPTRGEEVGLLADIMNRFLGIWKTSFDAAKSDFETPDSGETYQRAYTSLSRLSESLIRFHKLDSKKLVTPNSKKEYSQCLQLLHELAGSPNAQQDLKGKIQVLPRSFQ